MYVLLFFLTKKKYITTYNLTLIHLMKYSGESSNGVQAEFVVKFYKALSDDISYL